MIDPADLELVSAYKWHVSDTGYAVWRGKVDGRNKTVRMHRLIAGTPEGLTTDHLNHNRLDNRRWNLRVCTQADNMRNYKGAKDYSWDASKGKWIVRVRGQFCGRYKTEAEAMAAVKKYRSGQEYVPRRRKKYHLPTGVFKNSSNRGYQAKVQIGGVRLYFGTFSTVAEAEQAYLMAKKERVAS